jgi:hypothetical protein
MATEKKTKLKDQPAQGKKGGNWHFRSRKKRSNTFRKI